jgi:hypothetical protein
MAATPGQPGVGPSTVVSVERLNPRGAVGLSYDGGMPVVHAITALPYTETYIFRTVGTGPR